MVETVAVILKYAGVAQAIIDGLGDLAQASVEVTPELKEKIRADREREEARWAERLNDGS